MTVNNTLEAPVITIEELIKKLPRNPADFYVPPVQTVF